MNAEVDYDACLLMLYDSYLLLIYFTLIILVYSKAPRKLVSEIERRLNIVKEVRFEPNLMNDHHNPGNFLDFIKIFIYLICYRCSKHQCIQTHLQDESN